MSPVEELHWVSSDVAVWQAYDPAVKVDCTSTVFAVREGWLLVDPIPLAHACVEELMAIRPLAGLVLTSGNHQRASLDLRARYGVPIYAPPADDLVADHWLEVGKSPWEGVDVLSAAGAGPREISLRQKPLLIFGDAVIHLGELALLPDKYCESPKKLRNSLKQTLETEFTQAFFAHGWPILQDASRCVRSILI